MDESPRVNDALNSGELNLDSLVRDPGLRPSFMDYSTNQHDEIRIAYIKYGPYQLCKSKYPQSLSGSSGHIEHVIEKQTTQEIIDNRLRVRTFVEMIKWLTMQACALRGHDERPDSKNQGNFLELLKLIASYNKEVEKVILQNAPQNARYTSPDVQKEILQIFARNVQQSICDKKKEQMAIDVRFIDREGYVKERFLDLVHLQLALVAASKDMVEVHKFFKNLNFIVNVIDSSSKRHDQLQDAQVSEIAHLAEIRELESGKGVNQIQSLQRPRDTRWSSHYRSIWSLLKLYGPAIVVLLEIAINGSTPSQKGDATFDLTELLSFDFVIVIHLMKKIMKTTEKLCQSLQRKSHDIVNALSLISTTKLLIQNLRDQGCQSLLEKVVVFVDIIALKLLK
ncbi:uncharacterized protein [Rutidosis leptorrhynchoides]|uniref:uncharacterized protein n=1 Tax=Rutidosis leptorrhynchoides TaxID=125765 RepID=UPI003A9A373F